MDFYEYTKLHASQQISHSTRMDCYISVEFIAKNPFLRNKVRFQRLIDQDVVNEIIEAQKIHLKRRNQFLFPQPILFGFLNQQKEGYLLDGQHRFQALHHLMKWNASYKTLLIPVCVHQFETMEEMKAFFIELNKHTELSEEIMNADNLDDKELIEETATYFYSKYTPIFVKDEMKRVRLPKIRKNDFQNMVGMLLTLCKQYNQPTECITRIELINMIEHENKRYAKQDWYAFLSTKTSTYRNNVIAFAKESGFWLGFSGTHKEYYANWVLSCFQNHTHIEIIPTKQTRSVRKRKQTIPKSVKSAVWNRYIGKEIGESLCPICQTHTIQKDHFSAGHVHAESNGGKPTVDNLRPICSQCNGSMSTQHMKDFVKLHHPECYSALFEDVDTMVFEI